MTCRKPVTLTLLGRCLVAVLAFLAPVVISTAQQLDTPPAQPTDSAATPAEKNMFFPSVIASSTTTSARYGVVVVRPFTLVGQMQAPHWRALLSVQNPDETRWVKPGDRIGDIEVLEIYPGGASFRTGRTVTRLRLGQSMEMRRLDRKVFQDHGQLLGILRTDDQVFALAMVAKQDKPVSWRVGDVLPVGRITEVRSDGLLLEADGQTRILAVGQDTKELLAAHE